MGTGSSVSLTIEMEHRKEWQSPWVSICSKSEFALAAQTIYVGNESPGDHLNDRWLTHDPYLPCRWTDFS